MKHLLSLLLIFGFSWSHATYLAAQDLTVIEQDFSRALQAAAEEDKLLFIDFYTTWCAPCKQLENLVFSNDSIRSVLGQDVVMLKYDAENDAVFHLSKKYHVLSYPTGLLLNPEGYPVARRYSFSGNDYASLSKSVLDLVAEGVATNEAGGAWRGYANKIDPDIYPDFYINYIDRTDTDPDPAKILTYFQATEDLLSEAYFVMLAYFGADADDQVAEATVGRMAEYEALYGGENVEVAMYALVSGRFDRAVAAKDRAKYDAAVAFARRALDQGWLDDILPAYERDFQKALGNWAAVYDSYAAKKDRGEMDSGYINYFSEQVYRECDDLEVVGKVADWMKEVTATDPSYQYYKTHAFLLAKAGDAVEADRVARLALAAAKEEGKYNERVEERFAKIRLK